MLATLTIEFAIFQPGEKALAIPEHAEAVKIDAVVNDANRLRRKAIFMHQLIANLAGVHQYRRRKRLQVAEEFSPARAIPGQVSEIPAAGNNHWHPRQPRGRNSQQVRPKVVR